MKTKSFFASKINWLNIITVVITVLGYINADSLTAVGVSVDAQHRILQIVVAVVGMLNIVLRTFFTTANILSPTSLNDKQTK